MAVFQLHEVRAMRWVRDPGRDPHIDNADEIMDFIGRDRVCGGYEPRLGDEAILFKTSVSSIGIARLNAMDWVVIGPEGDPMAIEAHVFGTLVAYEIED